MVVAGAEILGVYGGSFDPPHVGHVMLPTLLKSQGLVDRLIVAPSADHPLKKTMSPFAERLRWTRAAMRIHGDDVEVTDLEHVLLHKHGAPSYTIRLLEALAVRHPRSRVRLVIGSDIVAGAENTRWHRWEEIVQRFPPIIVPRAGHADPASCLLPDVSSSQIRTCIEARAWDTVAQLVPRPVVELLQAGEHATKTIALVGDGHVAAHARPWLGDRGYAIEQISGHAVVRGAWHADAPLEGVWVLVRDTALPEVAGALAAPGVLPRGTPVLAAAGAVPAGAAESLGKLRAAGHPVGTLHPICSLRAETNRSWLGRAVFGVDGDPEALALARALAADQPLIELDDLDAKQRTAYHAACSLAANHLAVLLETAFDVFHGLGAPPQVARAALEVLMRSALENLVDLGIPGGITGPAARGDTGTVARHLEALPEDARELYAVLSDRLLGIVRRTR